jgi:hypothetical protein
LAQEPRALQVQWQPMKDDPSSRSPTFQGDSGFSAGAWAIGYSDFLLEKAELVLSGSRFPAGVGCLSPSVFPLNFGDFAVATLIFSLRDFKFFPLSIFASLKLWQSCLSQ